VQAVNEIIYLVTYLIARATKRQSEHWIAQLDLETRRAAPAGIGPCM
jgi:hypothetical protein